MTTRRSYPPEIARFLGIRTDASHVTPLRNNGPLEGFDPSKLAENDLKSERARRIVDILVHRRGLTSFEACLVGALPDGRWASVAGIERGYLYAWETKGRVKRDHSMQERAYHVSGTPPSFSEEQLRGLLDQLYFGIPWNRVLREREERLRERARELEELDRDIAEQMRRRA